MTRPKILLAGPLPPPFGGTTVLFDLLVRELSNSCLFDIDVVRTNTSRPNLPSVTKSAVALRLLAKARKADVLVLNLSSTSLAMGTLVAATAQRLWKKRVLIRKFGGSDHRSALASTPLPLIRAVALRALRGVDLYAAETRAAVAASRTDGIRAKWFPNHRKLPALDYRPNRGRRVVFMGQISRQKGVHTLLSIVDRLPKDMTLEFFGPLLDVPVEEFRRSNRTRYGGVVDPSSVSSVLSNYDALVLPTLHATEGYPGAILEALAVGIPVVASALPTIEEVVQHEVNGLLVDARDGNEVLNALVRLNDDQALFERLCAGARRTRSRYDAETWVSEFAQWLLLLAESNGAEDHGSIP